MVSEALADIADDLAVGDLLDSIDVLVDAPSWSRASPSS